MTDRLLSEQVLDGRYRIVRRIATGGMATVYLAEHVLIGRPVAIKVLHQQYAEDTECVQRFLAEGRTAGTLGHPHIVESTDMGYAAGGAPYLVLELLDGRTLHDVIQAHGRLPIERAVTIALQIASAVAAAHARGIIHRDLKSENIFLIAGAADDDHAKVLDFGISKFTERRGSTRKDKVLGTPWFMPPEQVEDPSAVDVRCDVYAMGAILYEMLAGETPFSDAAFPQVLVKILSEDPVPVERLRGEVSPELAAIVRGAMRKALPDRTASMDELGRSLAALAGRAWPEIAQPAPIGMSRQGPILPPPRRGRRALVVILVGALLGVTAAIGAVLASRSDTAGQPEAPPGELAAGEGARAVAGDRAVGDAGDPGERATGAAAGQGGPVVERLEPSPPAAPESVQLAIRSSTRGARVTLRGQTYRLPLRRRLARGEGEETIAISAPGRDTRRATITLDRDQTLTLEPVRRGAGRRGERSGGEDEAPEGPATPPASEPPAEEPAIPVVAEPAPPVKEGSGTPTAEPAVTRPVKEGSETRTAEPAVARPAPGTMDREATRRAVGRHLAEIRTCFERGRMDNPRLAGRVLVRIAIAPSGRVSSASIARSDVRSQQVESCIVSAVERWTLPRPAGGVAATITYPFSYH
jgi:TonB family protein